MNKKMRKQSVALLSVLFIISALIWVPAGEMSAREEDETSGLRADSLAINVGYYGGPYYQKKFFTIDELVSLGLEEVVYSYIDLMPSVCLNYARGVPLTTIMEMSGIDINSIQRFYFYTNDNKGGYFTDFTKKALLDTTRYYYPNLVFRYYEPDFAFKDDKQAAEGAIPVPTMMAVSDSWKRHLPGPDDFGEIDYSLQRTRTRFRLLFGQTDTETPTANRSAKWVHSINVMLGGGPTITTDVSVLEKEVGSNYRITATVKAADDLLAEQIKQALVWSTGDPGVAIVDNMGNVTITGEGEVEITVSYKAPNKEEVKASVRVKGFGAGSEESPDVEDDPIRETDPDPADKGDPIEVVKTPFGDKGTGSPRGGAEGRPATGVGKVGQSVLKRPRPDSKDKVEHEQSARNPERLTPLTRLPAEESMDAATPTGNILALRLGNVNQADDLLRMFKGGNEDKADREAVQNWRETEMTDTAVSLGWIDDPISMRAVLITGLALLLMSFVGRITEFYLKI